MQHLQFGIEGMAVHVPRYFIDLKTVAEAHGVDPAKYYVGLGGRQMAVPSPEEDAVTMAAEAVRRLLQACSLDPSEIGMLIVGSESGVDEAKPIASYVHGLVGLSPRCRTFDTKHACYGATAGLQLAGQWAVVGNGWSRKAIVVATDIARYEVGSPGEPTQGGGAVAMLVSTNPRLIHLDLFPDAVFTDDVMDFWRPNYSPHAYVDGKFSMECYLRALEHTYEAHRSASGLGLDDFRYLLFHVPFPKMAFKAFSRLWEREVTAGRKTPEGLAEAYDRMTRPSLWANEQVGNVYSGSLYLALAGLLEQQGAAAAGQRIGLFSYGSGSCAEFFSGTVGSDPTAWQGRLRLAEALAAREEVTYETYLRFRREAEHRSKNGSFVPEGDHLSNGHVRFLGISEHRRIYIPWRDMLPA